MYAYIRSNEMLSYTPMELDLRCCSALARDFVHVLPFSRQPQHSTLHSPVLTLTILHR